MFLWSVLVVTSLTAHPPAVQPLVVAHRGASHDAPENTLAAFRLAWQQGADAIEGDFFLSKDGHIVCIHDKTTRRLADKNLSVANSTLAQLRQLDVGKWKGQQFTGEKIPTLEEVLATIPEGKTLFLEVKCGPEIIRPIQAVLKKTQTPAQQIVLIAFDKNVIAESKKVMPEIQAQWLISVLNVVNRQKILRTAKEIRADGLDINARRLATNQPFLQQMKDANLQLHVWTVDDAKTAQSMIQMGTLSITTNKPLWLRNLIAAQN